MPKRRYFLSILIVLVVIVVWHIVIAPFFTRLPASLSIEFDLLSFDNFYNEQSRSFQGEQLSVSKFKLEATEQEKYYQLHNSFTVKSTNNTPIFSVQRDYYIDPNTRRHKEADAPRLRSGYLFGPKHADQVETFEYWHINYDGPALMTYAGEERLHGLRVLKYTTEYQNTVIDQTDDLHYLPGVPEERGVVLEPHLTIWIEPISGWLVKYEDQTTAYYYDQQTKERIAPWNTFRNTISNEGVAKQVRAATLQRNQVYIFDIVVPSALVITLLAVIILSIIESYTEKRNLLFMFWVVFFLVFSSSISLGSWWLLRQAQQEQLEHAFDEQTLSVEDAVTGRLETYKNLLVGAKGLFAASDSVERNEWRQYVESLQLRIFYPGVQGVGFAKAVQREDIPQLIEVVRNDGYPDFNIYPLEYEGQTDVHTSIIYLEPLNERNLRAFGFDMLSEETRRTAMYKARDTQLPTISGKVTLLQEGSTDIQAGFLMYIPVFSTASPASASAQLPKREELIGYVYSPFRMGDLMSGLVEYNTLDIALNIYDGFEAGDPDDLLFSSHPDLAKSSVPDYLKKNKTVFIENHPWTLSYVALNDLYVSHQRLGFPELVLALGLLLTVLVGVVLFSTHSNAQKIQAYAEKLTVDLEKNKQALIEAQHLAQVGSWELKIDQDYVSITPEFANIFELTAQQELPYETFISLFSPLSGISFDQILVDAVRSQETFSFVHHFTSAQEKKILTTKGTVKQIDDSFVVVGTTQNITQLKLAEQTLQKRTEELEKLNQLMINRELKMAELKSQLNKYHE